LIEDLPALRDMTIEMAKYIYREENPDRERVPKNFTKGISFELESIEEGSTIPKIVLIFALQGLFPPENIDYFERAKNAIVSTIQAAEDNEDISAYAPNTVLKQFNRLGKKLGDDETIEFSPNSEKKARFTKASRRRIIQASSENQEYTEETSLRGYISELDHKKKTFHIELLNGQTVEASLNEDNLQVVQNALISYTSKEKKKVLIEGVFRFNRNNQIEKIEETKSVMDLELKDVPFRLEEFTFLKNGWYNNEGKTFDNNKLNKFSLLFERLYNLESHLPNLYPSPEGYLHFEWETDDYDISLDVSLDENFSSQFQTLSFIDDSESENTYNLINEGEWDALHVALKQFIS
jgi:hypothetical protein